MFGIKQQDSPNSGSAELNPATPERSPIAKASEHIAVSTGRPDQDAGRGLATKLFKQASSAVLKPSIISEGFELVGDINSKGGIHVEGKIKGNICLDSATIGTHGIVEGKIHCKILQIKGTFCGEAVCNEFTISGAAVINGTVSYRSITMAQGASLTGKLIHLT